MRVNDVVAGLVLLAAAALMFVLTLQFPPFPGQKYGPSLFPRLLAGGIALCSLVLILRGIRNTHKVDAWLSWPSWMSDRTSRLSFLLVPGMIVFYILLSEPVGFIPVACVLLAVMFLWFGVKAHVAVPTALIATWVIHYFFANMMRVPLPRGILTNIL